MIKRFMHIKAIILFCLIMLLCASCKIENSRVINPGPVQATAPLLMNSVSFIEHDLNRTYITDAIFNIRFRNDYIKLSVADKGTRYSDGGYLELWALLRNHTDFSYQVEARTLFFDSDKAPLDNFSSWKRLTLSGNSLSKYSEYASSRDAVYYLIEIRQLK